MESLALQKETIEKMANVLELGKYRMIPHLTIYVRHQERKYCVLYVVRQNVKVNLWSKGWVCGQNSFLKHFVQRQNQN